MICIMKGNLGVNMLKKYEIELEEEIVEKASEIYNELGIDLAIAIRMFLVKSIRVDGIPFDLD